MSPTTLRPGARALGALLTSLVVVGAPSAALADTTPTATPTPTATADPSPSPSETPTPSATPTATPSATAGPTATPTPSASGTPTAAPSPDRTASRLPAVHPLSRATRLAAAASAAPQTGVAADFLARTLAADGDRFNYAGTTVMDGGITIDAILGLVASGTGGDQVAASLTYLEDHVGGYMGRDYASTYAGPTAKAIIGILAAGGSTSEVSTLVSELRATEGAVETGRFSDLPVACGYPTCDYSNTIGQSLAVIALVRAGQTPSPESVAYLADQQCTDGGFRAKLDEVPCASDADATAFATQALIAIGSDASAGSALDWLAALQNTDGSFVNSEGQLNTNTTGVAAQAFAAGGRDTEVAKAQAFIATLQYGCSAAPALRGAIAFTAADRSTGTPTDSDLRASGQATMGLAGESLLSVQVSGTQATGTTGLTCAPPSSSPSATSGPTTDPAVTSGSGGGSTVDPVAVAPAGALAQTGASPLLPVLVGLALLVLGAAAVLVARRRGAHA